MIRGCVHRRGPARRVAGRHPHRVVRQPVRGGRGRARRGPADVGGRRLVRGGRPRLRVGAVVLGAPDLGGRGARHGARQPGGAGVGARHERARCSRDRDRGGRRARIADRRAATAHRCPTPPRRTPRPRPPARRHAGPTRRRPRPGSGRRSACCPRNTIDCSASTRPRICGSARSCTIAVDEVMNVMLVAPDEHRDGERDRQASASTANRSMAAPNASRRERSPERTLTLVRRARGQRAEQRPEAQDREQQREAGVAARRTSRVTNSGNTTWKLNDSVPTIATIDERDPEVGRRRVRSGGRLAPGPCRRRRDRAGRSSSGAHQPVGRRSPRCTRRRRPRSTSRTPTAWISRPASGGPDHPRRQSSPRC